MTNLGLYTIPIDDHAIVRGHAVFDTATIVQGHLYRHRVHVDRFFESAKKAGLDFNFLLKNKAGCKNENAIDAQKGNFGSNMSLKIVGSKLFGSKSLNISAPILFYLFRKNCRHSKTIGPSN